MIILKKIAGIYSVLMGCSIIILWVILLTSNQVPELNTEPASIYFHIAAELLMAVLLLICGISFLLGYKWSVRLFTFSTGLLVYSVINSSGYYANNGQISMVIVFMIILILTLVILGQLIMKNK